MGICNQGERRVLVLNLCEESAGEDRSLRCSKRGAAPPFPIQPFASRLPDSYSTVTLSKSGEDVLLLQLAHRVRLISDGQETSKDTRIFRSFYVKEDHSDSTVNPLQLIWTLPIRTHPYGPIFV